MNNELLCKLKLNLNSKVLTRCIFLTSLLYSNGAYIPEIPLFLFVIDYKKTHYLCTTYTYNLHTHAHGSPT